MNSLKLKYMRKQQKQDILENGMIFNNNQKNVCQLIAFG